MDNEKARELSLEDLEQVAGGFTFESDSASNSWLEGYKVCCPHCGNEDAGSIHQGATVGRTTTHFICNRCGKPFRCRVAKKDFNARTGEWMYAVVTEPSPDVGRKF